MSRHRIDKGTFLIGWAVPGSIVANTYFINQFCTVHSSKGCALDARYVGAFTGVQSIGQILGMLGGPIISDRFGRKINIVCLILLLSLGVILEMVAKTDPVWLVARLFAGESCDLLYQRLGAEIDKAGAQG